MCNVVEISFFIALLLILLVYICPINTQNQNCVTLLLSTYQILFRYAERYCDDKEIMDNIMDVVCSSAIVGKSDVSNKYTKELNFTRIPRQSLIPVFQYKVEISSLHS